MICSFDSLKLYKCMYISNTMVFPYHLSYLPFLSLFSMGKSAKATRKGNKVRVNKKPSATPNASKSKAHPTRNKQSRNLSQKLKKAGLKK